ncbi:MAG: UvrB/UvrC motif-containing protein, partial [Bacteroidetes bacterium]|nr:UvrB/UvrC motif-containing protein [Bacteroidota bacterium]
DDEEEEEEKEKEKAVKPETKTKVKKEPLKKGDDFKSFTTDKLRDLLKDAIDKEDYERAAKIRDELGKRN